MHDGQGTSDEQKVRAIDSVRLDRTAFAVVGLHEADAIDKEYWRAQSPQARLEAMEFMRQVAYGYDPDTARLERILETFRRAPR
jgi:hypothetical protein